MSISIVLDCEELHRLLTVSNIDERSIAQILCNRSIGQRLQIREKYRHLFHQVDSIDQPMSISSIFFS